jgi:hypothetical protein
MQLSEKVGNLEPEILVNTQDIFFSKIFFHNHCARKYEQISELTGGKDRGYRESQRCPGEASGPFVETGASRTHAIGTAGPNKECLGPDALPCRQKALTT